MDDCLKIINAINEDKLELFNYLINHLFAKAYNPKTNTWVVTFDIDDEEKMTRLNKFLERE